MPRLLLVLSLLGLAPLALAQNPAPVPSVAESAETAEAPTTRDETLYVGEASVTSQGDAERRGATARALVQVLVRLSGDRAAPMSAVVRKALGHAEGLVRGAEYQDVAVPGVVGVPVRQNLVVRFDPSAVDALIAASGLRYWPPTRPRPLLWLAIDDGRGPRLVGAQQRNVVRPLAQRGLERGLRFGLPAGSAVESAAVDSVWAQNAAAMASLSARYHSDVQLLGKLYRASGGGWTSDWLLSQAGSELARWSLTDPDPQRAIAEGADGAADALAKRDAIVVDAGVAGEREVEIIGLRSAEDYTRLMTYLQTLAVVRGLQVLEASPGEVQLRLDLAVGEQGFAALLAGGSTLQALEPGADHRLRYQLQP